jgi:hypothetical protein
MRFDLSDNEWALVSAVAAHNVGILGRNFCL